MLTIKKLITHLERIASESELGLDTPVEGVVFVKSEITSSNKCKNCGKFFVQNPRGRRRKTCSNSCRVTWNKKMKRSVECEAKDR